MVGVQAEPVSPCIKMTLDVVLVGVVEERRAVPEGIFVCRDAEDVRRQHQGGLPLITVELMHRFGPVFGACEIALVLGDHKRNAIDEKHRVLTALLDALNAILVRRGEVVEVFAFGGVGNELNGSRMISRIEDYFGFARGREFCRSP